MKVSPNFKKFRPRRRHGRDHWQLIVQVGISPGPRAKVEGTVTRMLDSDSSGIETGKCKAAWSNLSES